MSRVPKLSVTFSLAFTFIAGKYKTLPNGNSYNLMPDYQLISANVFNGVGTPRAKRDY
jgi:hypothetical protein